ncbi:MAG: hypothetical protein HY867_14365 [Chloroflexi bacterium]|nr:hypothetical protein [Chloroflexota bacterium]
MNQIRRPLDVAILEALAYSDIFDYPLSLDELHRYLPVPASRADLAPALANLRGRVAERDGYYFLSNRDEIVDIRQARAAASAKPFARAMQIGRILGRLPFVRMVGLTGSLATLNLSKNPDLDFMLVASRERVWTARALSLLVGRWARLLGNTLCPNLIISETALEWPLRDLYSARELCQMIPVAGMDVYHRLRVANSWTSEFLPNAIEPPVIVLPEVALLEVSQTSEVWGARLLRGKLGDRLELWEMNRKVARLSSQPGFGEETVFNAEVCQGNFHHHRKWTREAYEERLADLGIVELNSFLIQPSLTSRHCERLLRSNPLHSQQIASSGRAPSSQ